MSLPVRTPDRPLRIVFVCIEGNTSGVHAKNLQKILNTPAVKVINSSVAHDIDPKGDYIKWRKDPEIRTDLRDADIIIHGFVDGSESLSRVRANSPENALIVQKYGVEWQSKDYRPLIKYIQRHFRISKETT